MACKRTFHARSVVLVMAALAWGCGDDDSGDGDGGADAAPSADSGGGTTADAGGGGGEPRIIGQILMVEARVNGVEAAGSGTIFDIAFTPSDQAVPPVYEAQPGSPFACKVFERTPEQFAYRGVDQGTVQITIEGGPEFPPCNFIEGEGYRCISTTGSGGDIASLGGPQFTLANPGVDFGADEVGRHIQISGATTPQNNGMFPIVAADDESITFINPTPGAAAEKGTAAMYRIVAGAGPAGQADPIPDGLAPVVELTSGGEGDLMSFTRMADGMGSSFSLDTASQGTISNIPVDGSSFTLSCEGEGGDCGQAVASGLNLVTTDGPIDGLPPDAMPPPVKKSVLLSCIFLGPTAVVPPEAAAYLQSSGATRIQTIFARVVPSPVPQGMNSADVVAGHAVAGITTP